MVPLYTLFLAALGGLKWVLTGRAARTERTFARAALDVEAAARHLQVKPGNAATADPLAVAKRQYELGRLVQLRDGLETAYVGWQARVDRVAKLLARLRGWKGRLVPYLFGVADLGAVLAVLYLLGLVQGPTDEAVRELAEALKR